MDLCSGDSTPNSEKSFQLSTVPVQRHNSSTPQSQVLLYFFKLIEDVLSFMFWSITFEPVKPIHTYSAMCFIVRNVVVYFYITSKVKS